MSELGTNFPPEKYSSIFSQEVVPKDANKMTGSHYIVSQVSSSHLAENCTTSLMNSQIMTMTIMICYVTMITSEIHKPCPVSPPIRNQLHILTLEGGTLNHNKLFGTINGSVSNISNTNNSSVSASLLTSNIHVISAHRIPVAEIEDDTFTKLVCLSEINFSYNVIKTISDKTFGNLTELKSLNLAVNRIEKISTNAYSGLKNLKSLDLSYNNISALIQSPFVQNVQLEYLNLSCNPMKRLAGVFSSLIRLKQLLLDHCSIAQFNTSWVKHNTLLEKLDISSNQMVILKVELNTFNKTAMQLWNFSNNCLPSLASDKIALEFSNSTTIIDLNNNMFNCSKWPRYFNDFEKNNIALAPLRDASGTKVRSWNCYIIYNKNFSTTTFIIVCCIIVSMFVVFFVVDYRAKLGYRQRIIDKVKTCFSRKPLQREASYNNLQVDF